MWKRGLILHKSFLRQSSRSSIKTKELQDKYDELKEGYDDLNLVHQGIVEHSTNVENELEELNLVRQVTEEHNTRMGERVRGEKNSTRSE